MNNQAILARREWRSWDLDLTFKGQRTYIQGGDIYNKIVDIFGRYNSMELQFHRLLSKSPVITLLAPDEPHADYDAYGRVVNDDTTLRIGLRTGTRDTSDRRFPYEEEAAIASAKLQEKAITQEAPFQYSFIEHVIALNKRLLTDVFSGQSVKWLFTKLEMSSMPGEVRHLRITYTKSLGTRLVISEIEANERNCGQIYFSELRPEWK